MPSDNLGEVTCEFHVGDIVVPKPGAPYGVTTDRWVGQVKSVERNTITCVTVCNTDGSPVPASSRRENVFWGLYKEHFEVI